MAVVLRPWDARLRGLVRLVRPLNVVMMAVGVAVGGVLAAGPAAFDGARLLLAMASAACIGAAANAVNDVFDLEIDRVNRPSRPLPAGTVPVPAARALWVVLSAFGIGLGAFLSWLHLGVAMASVVLLYGYSARLKRMPLAGNVAVALVLALALVYGGLAVGPMGGPLLLGAAFAFLATLAREVAKDVEDAAGDAAGGARTLPLAWGSGAATAVVAVVVAATLALMPLAGPAGLGAEFLALVLPAAALLLAALWALLSAPPEALAAHAGRASALFKAAMVFGLLALAGARLLA